MKFYIVDCFTDSKYSGNQLAVFMVDKDLETEEMQQIANEIGFSESTFIMSGKQPNSGYDVRIFTPEVEIPFAGHPTLGTSYIINNIIEGGTNDKIILNLKAGQIPVTVKGEVLTMTQNQPEFKQTFKRKQLAEILCIDEGDIRDDYPIEEVSTGISAIMIPLKDLDALRKCRVNHPAFQDFIDNQCKGDLLAFVEDNGNIRARVFVDDIGFKEDAATGSANGGLAGYLLKHNFFNSDDLNYVVKQGIEMNRPSSLHVHAALKNDHYTIEVGGSACIVAEGNWN